jgi:transposase
VDWPPYSPDLNPIENLWKLLKQEIIMLHPELSGMPKNLHILQRLCEAAVEVLEAFQARNLEESYQYIIKYILIELKNDAIQLL